MVLIFGGAYQGKLDFAKQHLSSTPSAHFDCIDSTEQLDLSYPIINNLDKYILNLVRKDIDTSAHIKELLPMLSDKTIIMNDISNGIVPLDPILRKWREAVGRCMVILAKSSDEVFRVYCGIDTKIK